MAHCRQIIIGELIFDNVNLHALHLGPVSLIPHLLRVNIRLDLILPVLVVGGGNGGGAKDKQGHSHQQHATQTADLPLLLPLGVPVQRVIV
jgi:hypothetical protein